MQMASSLLLCLYLLRDLGLTLLTSVFYSLLHLFYHSNPSHASDGCSFYKGSVWHERRHPLHHAFRYEVHYAMLNLDSPPSWFTPLPSRHMTAAECRIVAGTNGPVHLLTAPPSVGFEQNPISVYYCYNNNDDTYLKCCIAEVTNTPWAERVIFTFEPKGDLVPKLLHVSPFMDMLGSWNIHASNPGEQLSLTIFVEHPNFGRYFTATLQAERVDWSVRNPAAFFWLMPHKVVFGIYWQALILWWKGVAFQSHPKDASGVDYRKHAMERDRGHKFCTMKNSQEGDSAQTPNSLSQTLTMKADESEKHRYYTWHEAQWPWT